MGVRMADEAAHLGASPSSESYLRIEKIIAAARRHGAEAIHPGYGFLSENAEFGEACAAAGIVFIGPPAEAIRKMGSKTAARKIAIAADAPVVPGTQEAIRDIDKARQAAKELGDPVLLKQAAGGGARGCGRVDRGDQREGAIRGGAREDRRAFRRDRHCLVKDEG